MTHTEIKAVQRLIAIAKEIAHDPNCDLVDSERRIRLYYALEQAGLIYQSWNIAQEQEIVNWANNPSSSINRRNDSEPESEMERRR